MNKARFALFLLLTLAWLGAAGHRALAARLVAPDAEYEVPSDVFSNSPAVAAQPDGSYVVAWDDDSLSLAQGALSYEHVAAGEKPGHYCCNLLYSPAGVPDVDAVTAGRQGFDVLWHTRQYDDDPAPTLFYRAHLDLRGIPVGKPVRLGGAGTEWVWQVRGSGYMAGWSLPSKHGIAARRLTTAGQRTGPQLSLNSRPIDRPAAVSVVGLADASLVAVWLGVMPGSPGTTVLRARRFSPSGKPLGPDFDVNTVPLGALPSSDFGPPALRVAAAPGGGFVVAWALFHDEGHLRWLNASGTPLGPELKSEFPESLAFDDTGNLVLFDIYQVHLYDPQGSPLGGPVDVNDDVTEEPLGGDVTWAGDSWVVAYVAAVFPYDQSSIFVRRFVKK
jgi:hypothetical protein